MSHENEGGQGILRQKPLGEFFSPIPSIDSFGYREDIPFIMPDVTFSPSWELTGVGEASVAMVPLFFSKYKNDRLVRAAPLSPIIVVEFNNIFDSKQLTVEIECYEDIFVAQDIDLIGGLGYYYGWQNQDDFTHKTIAMVDVDLILSTRVKFDMLK